MVKTIQNSKETNEPFIIRENNNAYVLFRGGYRRILKEVVDVKRIEVPARCYNVLRSFTESSPRVKYVWNIGIANDQIIQFIKPYRWRLVIDKYGISLYRYDDNTRIIFVPNIPDELHVHICGHEVVLKTELDQLATVITSEVPAAREIPIFLIMDKIKEYINI
ncbi:MAG: hypothetical protein QXS16_05160 [Pyrobaculum sp.]